MPAGREREKRGGVAIIVGGAEGVRREVREARKQHPGATLLGCNRTPHHWPVITEAWTLHPELIDEYRVRRPDVTWHGCAADRPAWHRCDVFWPDLPQVMTEGSSGWTAGIWARHLLGYERVILCGVWLEPGTAYERRYHQQPVAGNVTAWQHCAEEAWKQGLCDGITSMGGWTRTLLG